MSRIACDYAESWLQSDSVDADTKASIRRMIALGDSNSIIERFYGKLEFGTGGLRALMGIGTNYINRYTIATATQGLSNYLNKLFSHETIAVAVAYDSRHNSDQFASITAQILSANGIVVHIFPGLRPTPLLSFAVRQLGCKAGVVVTASHNPKAYNGYKVYGQDGAQLTSPHDSDVVGEINALSGIDQVKWSGDPQKIKPIDKSIETNYFGKVKQLLPDRELIVRQHAIPIVYSSLHGTGITMVPECLKHVGFHNCIVVQSQQKPDGAFPTVDSPNPEDPAAMQAALDTAREHNADIAMATDPDADRVGVGIRKDDGGFMLLNGNQLFSLILWFILSHRKPAHNAYIVKTIVTSELVRSIAEKWNVACYDTLTGFKYIAELIRKWEGKKTFIAAGEESYGFLLDTFTRDKDAVCTCAFLTYMAACARDSKKTLYDWLMELYTEFGVYRESSFSMHIKKAGDEEQISKKIKIKCSSSPSYVDNEKIIQTTDFKSGEIKYIDTQKVAQTTLPRADVFQLFTDRGTKISIRPSGTEPKIKFYISVKGRVKNRLEYQHTALQLENKIKRIKRLILSL